MKLSTIKKIITSDAAYAIGTIAVFAAIGVMFAWRG